MKAQAVVTISMMAFLGGYAFSGLVPSHAPSQIEANISPAPSTLPFETRALSGVWEGSWGGNLASRVVVERIHPGWATVLLAWGDLPKQAVNHGWMRVRAKLLSDGQFHVAHPVNLTFTVSEDGMILVGTKGKADPTTSIVLRRAESNASLAQLTTNPEVRQ